MNVTDILRDLVAIDTIRDRCNGEIMDYIDNFLKKYDFTIERRKNAENQNELLIASIGDNAAMGFIGHTDTVDITEGWDTDPFVLTEKNDMLYGLGACDMKSGIAAILWAAANAPLEDIKAAGSGIKLYFTYDEEIMFSGIKNLVSAGEEFPPHMLIAEPTNLVPMIGSKGILEYIFSFRGTTTHSSMPVENRSSNKNAVRFLSRMLDFEAELRKNRTELFDIPYTTMNIGIIEGGTAINKVPDKTTIYLDFRICDSESEYKKIREFVDNAISEFDADYTIINDVASFRNESGNVSFYENLSGNKGQAFWGITEGSFFEGDRVILGAGPMTCHEANEHVSRTSLEKTAEIYLEAIKRKCAVYEN